MEGTRFLHPAVPRGTAARPEGVVRIRVGGRGGRMALIPVGHRTGGSAGHRAGPAAGHRHRREPVHRTVSAHRRRRPRRSLDDTGTADVSAGNPTGPPLDRLGHRRGAGDPRAARRAGQPPTDRTERTMTTPHTRAVPADEKGAVPVASRPGTRSRFLVMGALITGAVVFLFPFYYMVVASLQLSPNLSLGGAFPSLGNLTLDNYAQINAALNLWQSLLNSGIFTGGVLLGTMVFGVLGGYALAMLHFRGRGVLFSAMLLVLVVPFQLSMIPLYVLIARDYGLGDTYLGMILPFAINSTAVFIFRQYFLQLPSELFDAARIDGAGELRTAVLLTFIGPWNEFLWPFLITKQQAKQPLAVALANYISTVQASTTNPYGSILAGAVVLALPVIVLFVAFQRQFVSTDLGSGVKG